MTVKLSGRMSALAALVTPGHRLADVGCDHGYIPIFLCRTGRIPSAVAMDINQGPLERAERNIAAYGLQGRIQTRISDGLRALGEDEADTVLIAGMGGYLVKRILTEEGAIPESVVELILQPQSDLAEVRRCVREVGFFIADEDMVEEEGKFYPMMKARRRAADCFPEEDARRTVAEVINRQDMEDLFGPVLLEKRHPVLKRWLEKELRTTEAILSRLDANPRVRSRKQELLGKERLLQEALRRYSEYSHIKC